jgi:glucosylceramidase
VVEIAGSRYRRNAEYYVLGHGSRFLGSQAVLIGSRATAADGLQYVAFEKRNHSRVLIVLNTGPARRSFRVADAPRSFAVALPAGAVATYTWR